MGVKPEFLLSTQHDNGCPIHSTFSCRMGGKAQISPSHSQFSKKVGAPSLAGIRLSAKGGKAPTLKLPSGKITSLHNSKSDTNSPCGYRAHTHIAARTASARAPRRPQNSP